MIFGSNSSLPLCKSFVLFMNVLRQFSLFHGSIDSVIHLFIQFLRKKNDDHNKIKQKQLFSFGWLKRVPWLQSILQKMQHHLVQLLAQNRRQGIEVQAWTSCRMESNTLRSEMPLRVHRMWTVNHHHRRDRRLTSPSDSHMTLLTTLCWWPWKVVQCLDQQCKQKHRHRAIYLHICDQYDS